MVFAGKSSVRENTPGELNWHQAIGLKIFYLIIINKNNILDAFVQSLSAIEFLEKKTLALFSFWHCPAN